jgi:protein transport protein SEC24
MHVQVVCETIKAALDSLPGDERTLVGLVTYDAHVHFYNLSARLPPPFL